MLVISAFIGLCFSCRALRPDQIITVWIFSAVVACTIARLYEYLNLTNFPCTGRVARVKVGCHWLYIG